MKPAIFAFCIACVVACVIFLPTVARADLTVCNQTGQLIAVAIVEPSGRTQVNWLGVTQNRLKSHGWWQIQAGGCRDILSGRVERDTGVRAEGGSYASPDDNWFKGCVNENDRFLVDDRDYLNEEPCPAGTVLRPFVWLSVGDNDDFTYTFR